jgi:glycogen debranching enzyme
VTTINRANRKATARFLSENGFPISWSHLARLAQRGEGPPFAIWGRDAMYSLDEALQWAQRRLAASRRCGAATANTE